MPLSGRKVREIIREEVQSIDERCTGYREVLADTIDEIIDLEGQHQVESINIIQRISGRCDDSGSWLADHAEDIPGALDGA